jgi:hypothetical protein
MPAPFIRPAVASSRGGVFRLLTGALNYSSASRWERASRPAHHVSSGQLPDGHAASESFEAGEKRIEDRPGPRPQESSLVPDDLLELLPSTQMLLRPASSQDQRSVVVEGVPSRLVITRGRTSYSIPVQWTNADRRSEEQGFDFRDRAGEVTARCTSHGGPTPNNSSDWATVGVEVPFEPCYRTPIKEFYPCPIPSPRSSRAPWTC